MDHLPATLAPRCCGGAEPEGGGALPSGHSPPPLFPPAPAPPRMHRNTKKHTTAKHYRTQTGSIASHSYWQPPLDTKTEIFTNNGSGCSHSPSPLQTPTRKHSSSQTPFQSHPERHRGSDARAEGLLPRGYCLVLLGPHGFFTATSQSLGWSPLPNPSGILRLPWSRGCPAAKLQLAVE